MDCEMPVMDGFTATKQLREREKLMQISHTPVVALTAHAIDGVREKCLASGMNDFLTKPFSYAEITGKVAQWAVAGTDSVNQQRDDSMLHMSVLEPHALNQLRARQNYRKKDLVKRVVSIYLEQTPKLLEELATAGRQADMEALSHLAHTLKSSSMTIGAAALAESCKMIEVSCDQGRFEQELISKPALLYPEVEQELRDVLVNE
jgi:CheY-like chemotaxis protein